MKEERWTSDIRDKVQGVVGKLNFFLKNSYNAQTVMFRKKW